MSEHEPPALADLARALTDLGVPIAQGDGNGPGEGWLVTLSGPYQSFTVYEDGGVRMPSGLMTPEMWQTLDLIRRWQAPPRPDAATFEQADDWEDTEPDTEPDFSAPFNPLAFEMGEMEEWL